MDAFNDWEIDWAPYIDEDRTVEVTVRVWEHSETFNALAFIDEIKGELAGMNAAESRSAEIYFRTWDDVDGCPSRSVSLTFRRPATEREIKLNRARQIKSVMEDRAWLEQRMATLLEDAERAGIPAQDMGIAIEDGAYTFVLREKGDEE
jgi:hypothetical protein